MQSRPALLQRFEGWLCLPTLGWMGLFFLLPTLIIFFISLRSSDEFGGIGAQWTLETWLYLFNRDLYIVIARTLLLSSLTALFCLALALPSALAIFQIKSSWRPYVLLLVIIPFWVNFLIRIFAWKVLLHPDGYIKQALVFLHLCQSDSVLLYGEGAVLLIMVYSYLPYAILPIYAAIEKFNPLLLEAARDLGATRLNAFWSIFIPNIKRGLISAAVMVFVPAMGAYVIPDMVGGIHAEMISSKISQRVFIDRNLPLASALSALLTLSVLLPFVLSQIRSAKTKQGDL